MVVKTITIMEDAYNVLKGMKGDNESFSEVIRRVGKKRPLSDFFGVLSKETADALEKSIMEFRKRHTEEHRRRVARIVAELEGD